MASNDAPARLTARIPVATYRLQFNKDFTFRDAAALVPYLHDLGISDIYASPILQARGGSSHGYDICDPTRLNAALGTAEDFAALVQALHDHDMGLLLDTVPNHMGIGDPCNSWWLDVLENGPSSPYATFFDIDWYPAKPELQNRVLLPVLEDQYGAVLEGGKLRLSCEDGGFWIYYYQLKLPVAPGTYRIILNECLEGLQASTTPDRPEPDDVSNPALLAAQAANVPASEPVLELQSILTAVSHLPTRLETDPLRVAERYREKEVIKRRLATAYQNFPEVSTCLDETLARFNGRPGDPQSFDLLDGLLDVQIYRLAYWRVAGEEINYRRFFDINDLAAIRVEVPEVFQATHQLILRLLQEGSVNGLRIDHPDGLWDPTNYFGHLQASYLTLRRGEAQASAPAGDTLEETGVVTLGEADAGLPLYVVAEKILSEREPLPQDWAVHGTTGYDFLASVNNLFVHRGNADAFERIYSQFIGQQINLDDLVIQTKMEIMRDSLASEINALSHLLERIGERNRHYRDFTLNGITAALREVVACLPVYRTYINAVTGEVPERDRKFVDLAVRRARRRRPGLADAAFEYIRNTLLLRNMAEFSEADQLDLANFVMKFQQMTGPVMAKGVEDTAFYIYNRLASLNEVGNSPDQFGITVAEFHRDNGRRAQRWPHSLLATSTHDNKRSEDVRARLDVLSELPEAWRTALARWSRQNHAKKATFEGGLAPDRNDEYLLYQTLLSAWPLVDQGDGGISTNDAGQVYADRVASRANGARPALPQGGAAPGRAGGLAPRGDATPAGSTEGQADRMEPAGRDDQSPEFGEGRAPKSEGPSAPPAEDLQGAGAYGAAGTDAAAPAGTDGRSSNVLDTAAPDWDRGHDDADPWTFLLRPTAAEDGAGDDAYAQFCGRMVAYAQKAAKEAKVHTSWITPDEEYDQALHSFVERLLAPGKRNAFLDELARLARRVTYYGQYNALAQVLLKLTSPGVPDIYQGNEVWDFSLVDPDNRRPVDYGARQAWLAALQEQFAGAQSRADRGEGSYLDLVENLLAHSPDGRIKLYVTWRGLTFRHAHADLFGLGSYLPLAVEGSKAEYVCAFARGHGDQQALTVVPRLIVGLTNDIERPPLGAEIWGDTWLSLPDDDVSTGTTYRNVLTGETLRASVRDGHSGLPLAAVLGYFPVALLERGD